MSLATALLKAVTGAPSSPLISASASASALSFAAGLPAGIIGLVIHGKGDGAQVWRINNNYWAARNMIQNVTLLIDPVTNIIFQYFMETAFVCPDSLLATHQDIIKLRNSMRSSPIIFLSLSPLLRFISHHTYSSFFASLDKAS